MDENLPDKRRLFWQRVFIVLFFGLALLISVTTIVGSLRGWSEATTAPAANGPAG